jgi:hypothetical protein
MHVDVVKETEGPQHMEQSTQAKASVGCIDLVLRATGAGGAAAC